MFAQKYFKRYKVNNQIFDVDINHKIDIAVVIPCYDDEDIFDTLYSLEQTADTGLNIEVIVVVNSAENTSNEIVIKNRQIYEKLLLMGHSSTFYRFTLRPIIIEDVPTKISGVGNARKIGMEEAIRHFDKIENPNGIIVSLDSDCKVAKEYFSILKKLFSNPKHKAATINFMHQKNDDKKLNLACRKYELYMRYFRLAMEFAGLPYAIHTIGSCFALRAETYIKTGGMPRLQAGEDFYFLHKVSKITNIIQLKNKLVFPSSRTSDRVPFGTGKAIKNIALNSKYEVYDLQGFSIIKSFFDTINLFFENIATDVNIPSIIEDFYGKEKLYKKIDEIKHNSNGQHNFRKRFFDTFDAFFIIKFLNFYNKNSSLETNAKAILDIYGIKYESNNFEDIYDKIEQLDCSSFILL